MCQQFLLRLIGIAVLIAAGLGLGYGGARWWRADSSLAEQDGTKDQSRGVFLFPAPDEKSISKRALLIGVTKYDHLDRVNDLVGPANDVRLMRRFLEEQYRFPTEAIVTLAEDEGAPARRPTRANIEREFRRLATESREGDQVVILLAGHGGRQPESDPPDPDYPEPDGIDEIFLPADVRPWQGFPERVPNAVVDDEIRVWLGAITAKKAFVWIIFDCCHSGTMTRGTEVVRELPPHTLVPQEELDKARKRAAQRGGKVRGIASAKPAPFVPKKPSDYLVAVYACRAQETTPESLQAPGSPNAKYHGLLTYTLVDILTKSATSKAPLTYRELVQRLQIQYAGRPQGSPTPTVEGKGQDRVVLGIEQPARSRLLLTRDRDLYKVNAGEMFGLTTGSVLAVYSPAGIDETPKRLGHVRIVATQPFEATVEPCLYEKTPLAKDLPSLCTCQPVLIDYGLRRFKVAAQVPKDQVATRQELLKALEPLSGAKGGLVELVEDPRQAEWLVRLDKNNVQLVEASGNRTAIPLPGLESPNLGEALRLSFGRVFRARNLVALAGRFEEQRYRGNAAVDIEVEVLRHKGPKSPGEVWPRPADGWVFRPGDLISFRVHNKSSSLPVDVTLLIVGSDFQIHPYYPRQDEVVKSLSPGESFNSPPPHGEIGNDPPFGPECLVVIAVPAKNPAADFTALAQDGLPRARAADRGENLRSPLGELLEFAMYRVGSRSMVLRQVAEQHGMRVLPWRTEQQMPTAARD